jgi:hypothetical protein
MKKLSSNKNLQSARFLPNFLINKENFSIFYQCTNPRHFRKPKDYQLAMLTNR